MRPARKLKLQHAGFTLVELMITVVIIGIMSAVALPLMTRDRAEDATRGFASSLAKDLQRARFQAIGDRLPVRAFVFLDRVEFRQAQGVDGGGAPVMPTVVSPAFRVLGGKAGIQILDITNNNIPQPSSAVLTTATFKEIQLDGMGRAMIVGQPDLPVFVWIENTNLAANHPYRRLRIDISPLTGFVQLRENWN